MPDSKPNHSFGATAEFMTLRYAAGGHPLTRVFSQRLGAAAAYLAQRAGLTPSGVTLLGLATFLLAAFLFASLPSGAGATLACAVLMQLAYALDCADGQLARATGRTSAFGAWLDVACDYARCVALAFAASWFLARQMAPSTAALCSAAFLAGATIQIHTATLLRTGAAPALPEGRPGRIRWLVTLACDTAVVLLMLALLRGAPALLAAYLVATGGLYLIVSIYLARARLGGAGA